MAKVIFLVVSTITVLAALAVVSLPNVFHAALGLVLALLGIAGLYALLGAGYVAVVQVLIYVGAVSVLIILAIMVSERPMQQSPAEAFLPQRGLTALVSAVLFVLLVSVALSTAWPVVAAAPPMDMVARLGEALVERYLLPFEVASVVLLISLVGAVYIAREP
ncbi:MAG: NADH-quinone oxidoreductase subunit J [Anaerolineae bacterium]|nr:NADH-quinone oxidoreductase subunit J [Anaerolineae bacterium]